MKTQRDLIDRAEEIRKSKNCSTLRALDLAKEEEKPLTAQDWDSIRDALEMRIRGCKQHVEAMTGVNEQLRQIFQDTLARAELTWNKLEVQGLI